MKRLQKNSTGLSLVELLIAIGILAAVAVSLSFNFYSGAHLYTRSEQEGGIVNQYRLLLAKIENDLLNMVATKEVPFKGKTKEMSFSSYATVYEEEERNKQLLKITYRFKNKGIKRITELIQVGSFQFRSESKQSQYLLRDVPKIVFEYGYLAPDGSIVWRDYWDTSREEALAGLFPAAIQIELTYYDESEREQVIEKKISIQDGIWKENVFRE